MGHILTGYYRILMFHCCHENIHTEKYKKPHLHIQTLYMKNITHTHAFKRLSVSLTLQKKCNQPQAAVKSASNHRWRSETPITYARNAFRLGFSVDIWTLITFIFSTPTNTIYTYRHRPRHMLPRLPRITC